MSAAASSQPTEISGPFPSARGGRAAIAFLFAIVLGSAMTWTGNDDGFAASIRLAPPPHSETDVVVVSLASLGFPETPRAVAAPAPPITINPWTPKPLALRAHHHGAPANTRRSVLPKFAAAYRSVLKLVALMQLPRIQEETALAQAMIVGTASTYNPYRDGKEEGGVQTASGEIYDPAAWTAAIQIDLRGQFNGVRYGRNYRPAFALVESGDKRAIVKINDVGPLKPGRVIDLNERSMRYFDPFLRRGLLSDTKVTLLPGADWTPGPVGGVQLASFAGAQ